MKDCYAFQSTEFKIMKYLAEFFEQHKHVEEIEEFLNSCLYCKKHEHSCINSIDLTLLLPAIKFELTRINPKYAWAPQNIYPFMAKFLRSEDFYRFWRNFNYKIIPQEFRRKFDENRKPQKREVVFFSGCGIQMLENQYYILCDIFKKLNVDFGLIDGSYLKPICCGAVHCEAGNFESGIRMLKNLIMEVNRFGTKKVIVYCATCYFGLKTLAPELIPDYDLEVVHATNYLSEFIQNNSMHLLENPKHRKKVYTIHDSCHLAHGKNGDTTSIRNLISLLPNASISEMKHNKGNSLCDLYYVLMELRNPFTFFLKKNKIRIIDEAVDAEADILCSLCPGCHAILSIFGSDIFTLIGNKKPRIPVKNWVSILGGYLGIEQRDMLNYRFKHIITVPLKDSGLGYIWQAFKAIVRGYIGKKEPKTIEKKLKVLRKKKNR
ncbi:MAG: heterodisulfide reductase-related iron-sulfur binding cluster [Promethearchaeota archaeon]